MRIANENLRLLLFRSKIKREKWATHLADWAQCSEDRAEKILYGAPLDKREQELIAAKAEVSEDEIQSEKFLGENINIVQENIKYLTNKNLSGLRQVDIANEIGVKDVTLSRWKSGSQEPEVTKLQKLCILFKLPAGTDLKKDPIFLSPDPIGDLERKEWLKKMIEKIDSETLNEIFPALLRLLKER